MHGPCLAHVGLREAPALKASLDRRVGSPGRRGGREDAEGKEGGRGDERHEEGATWRVREGVEIKAAGSKSKGHRQPLATNGRW